jgi:hypothetical protein
VVATATAVELLVNATLDLLSLRLPIVTVGVISGALLSLLGAVTVTRLGLWRQLGLLRYPAQPRALLWFLPFVIYGVLPLTEGLHVSADKAAAALTFGLLIAFWKLIMLAVLLYAWLPRGARWAAAATTLFWASMHLGGTLTGATVVPTFVLSLSYLFLAFAFVAVRLRTGLLWPMIATYAVPNNDRSGARHRIQQSRCLGPRHSARRRHLDPACGLRPIGVAAARSAHRPARARRIAARTACLAV